MRSDTELDRRMDYTDAAPADSARIISSAVGFILGFRSGLQVLISMIILWIRLSGVDNTFLLNTTSLRAFHVDHKAPAQIKQRHPLIPTSTFLYYISKHRFAVSGGRGHPKQVLRKDLRNTVGGHWKSIWSEVSGLPHIKQTS